MWPDAEATQELIIAAKGGDAEAIGRLLMRHRESLRQVIDYRLDPAVRNRVDASDIVQDVLIEANRRLSDYLADPKMPFHLWLRSMAKDHVIDAHRRHRLAARRSVNREVRLAGHPTSGESTLDLAAQLAGHEMTPATAATWQELNQRFHAACEELEEQDREIIFMRHFEQLSNSEVATALDVSPQAASMRYLRAMRRLRSKLDEG